MGRRQVVPAQQAAWPPRYDKLAANDPAFIKLASIRIWLRADESAD
jgi:transposase